MNKIFKVIWSKTKNCWIVASELAKRKTKSSIFRIFSKLLVASILCSLLNFSNFVNPVYAATAPNSWVNWESVNEGTAYPYINFTTTTWDYFFDNCSFEINDVSSNGYSASGWFIDWSKGAIGQFTWGINRADGGYRYFHVAANPGGKIALGNMGFIRGDTEYKELRPSDNGNCVEICFAPV